MHLVHGGNDSHIRRNIGLQQLLPTGKAPLARQTEPGLEVLAPHLIRLGHSDHLKPVGLLGHLPGIDGAAVSNAHKNNAKLFHNVRSPVLNL